MLVAHYNDMRNCRNSYIEAAVSLSGRDKSQRLKELAAEFKVLKSKTADHVAAVENLNGHPVPMRDNLEKLPPVEQVVVLVYLFHIIFECLQLIIALQYLILVHKGSAKCEEEVKVQLLKEGYSHFRVFVLTSSICDYGSFGTDKAVYLLWFQM